VNPFRKVRPGFIVIPLDVRHPFAITLLASTISLTPGTVSANLSGDRRSLLVHSFDLADEAAAVAAIKNRYERRIREIFE
jgi:multicomponent K+:H+ antiporter subunit E